MKKQNNHIQTIAEIKVMMEKSSKFLSLSGLSGVSAGLTAITGAVFAFFYLDFDQRYFDPYSYFNELYFTDYSKKTLFLLMDGVIVLILAVLMGSFFSIRKSKKNGYKFWDKSAKHMLANLALPLITGGIFCLILLYYNIIFLIAPATLIFYGLALINASKYTLPEIKILGILETTLGLIACYFAGYGLIFWGIGFGFLHIIYGTVMYFKYEGHQMRDDSRKQKHQ